MFFFLPLPNQILCVVVWRIVARTRKVVRYKNRRLHIPVENVLAVSDSLLAAVTQMSFLQNKIVPNKMVMFGAVANVAKGVNETSTVNLTNSFSGYIQLRLKEI